MRKPKIENKYNLKPKDIERAVVLDYEKLHQKPFWRNDVIQAWCLSEAVIPNPKDPYGTFDLEYWIGFSDKNAKENPGKIRLSCSSYGGMCGYSFESFFNPKEIENDFDLQLQEKLLARMNWLIDEGIIKIEDIESEK